MIMKIMGFDIEIDINKDKTNILVIDDHKLFGSFCYNLNRKDTEKVVFIDNDNWSVLVNEEIAGTSIIEKVEGNKVNVYKKSIKILIK